MTEARLPEVAIVGRPNVGKSTLFNRIVGRRQAIVGPESGLTRDRHRAEALWNGRRFMVTDTGGVEWGATEELLQLIRRQAFSAVAGADVVLYVVDGRAGLAPVEEELAAELRRTGQSVVLVVNKCDGERQAAAAVSDFHALGLSPVHATSAEHGFGVGDLLDSVVDRLPEFEDQGETETDGVTRIAVVGRPNVGKSSLVNALLGDERVIVSEIAGTTRDAIDTALERDGRPYVLIDTAGIRRGGRRDTFAENVSVAIARKRMQRADVAFLVADASEGLSRQDVTIAAEAGKAGCGLVVVVNKWDLVQASGEPRKWAAELGQRMGRIGFATFAFVSALTGEGVEKLLPLADKVQHNRLRRIPTSEVNSLFEHIQRRGTQAPPGAARPKYLTQVGVAPPAFVVFVGGRGEVPAAYRRYLENRLRAAFDFTGTPMILRVRRSGRGAPATGNE